MDAPLCLLSIHAHPDDEASKGASTVAKYHDEGVRTVLVCCTGGEAGDILNPAMDRPEVRGGAGPRIRDGRARDGAAQIIGYDVVEMLGYRDSGMPDTDDERPPRLRSPTHRSRRPSAGSWRSSGAERPQVIVSYSDDQQAPTSTRTTSESTTSPVPAFDAAADPDQPSRTWASRGSRLKLYYTTWSRARIEALHLKRSRSSASSRPTDDHWFTRPSQDDQITTKVPRRRVSDRLPRAEQGDCWPTPPRSTPRRSSGSACPTTSARDAPHRGTTTSAGARRAWCPVERARGRSVRRPPIRGDGVVNFLDDEPGSSRLRVGARLDLPEQYRGRGRRSTTWSTAAPHGKVHVPDRDY